VGTITGATDISGIQLSEKLISGLEYIIEFEVNQIPNQKQSERTAALIGISPEITGTELPNTEFAKLDDLDYLATFDLASSQSFCLRVHTKSDISALFVSLQQNGKQTVVPIQSLSVTDIPQPRMEGPGTVCPGEKITLQSNLDYSAYRWTRDNQVLLEKNTPSIEVSAPGMYRLTGLTAQGCEAASISLLVREDLICQSITDFNYFEQEETTQFNALADFSNEEVDYFWSFGDGNTSKEVSPVHTFKYNGTYKVCLSKQINTATGSAGDRSCKTVVVKNSTEKTAAKKQITEKQGLTVFPNPNKGEFKLMLEGVQPGEEIQLSIFDEAGRNVWSQNNTASASGFYKKISLDNLATGIYFIRVTTPSNNYNQRLVIY